MNVALPCPTKNEVKSHPDRVYKDTITLARSSGAVVAKSGSWFRASTMEFNDSTFLGFPRGLVCILMSLMMVLATNSPMCKISVSGEYIRTLVPDDFTTCNHTRVSASSVFDSRFGS